MLMPLQLVRNFASLLLSALQKCLTLVPRQPLYIHAQCSKDNPEWKYDPEQDVGKSFIFVLFPSGGA